MNFQSNYSARKSNGQLSNARTEESSAGLELNILSTTDRSFSFQKEELAQKLRQACDRKHTGYWQFQFDSPDKSEIPTTWFLGFSAGRVIFSGKQMLSWEMLLAILQRYVSRLQANDVKKSLLLLETELKAASAVTPDSFLDKIQKSSLATQAEIIAAVKSKILADFDTYLFARSGTARFIEDSEPRARVLMAGFDLGELIELAMERHLLWRKLRAYIPSMNAIPSIDREALNNSSLTAVQKQKLGNLVKEGNTLNGIAIALAKDSLEIAKIFAPTIARGLVKLSSPFDPSRANDDSKTYPKIFIIDDSPIMLKQFQSVVSSWGYRVELCQDPMLALKRLELSSPQIIFIDINMPEISGFDLVKLIRRQPQLVKVPIVILTGEQKLSNKWRAQWSNCKFIIKPLASDRVQKFKTELQALLSELVPPCIQN